MRTECNTDRLDFQPLQKRQILGIFDGGAITSDGGGLLPREVESKTRIIERFAECFTDHRDPERIEHGVDYILGLAKNPRLGWEIYLEQVLAKAECQATGKAARRFRDFTYQTRKSWSRARRVVGKAEHLAGGANPRFVVTSLSKEEYDARPLYEDVYCERGDMENRIKEQQLMLFADRTSADDMRANQIRLYFSSITYVLMSAMRRMGLAETSLERAQCSTIRLKLLKVGALIRITVRKIWISFSSSYPYKKEFFQVLDNIRGAPPPCVLRC